MGFLQGVWNHPNTTIDQIGYAWGCEVPVLFVARHGENLHFDVSTHRCIYYRTIGQLAREWVTHRLEEKQIQATLWELRIEDIVRATEFVAR